MKFEPLQFIQSVVAPREGDSAPAPSTLPPSHWSEGASHWPGLTAQDLALAEWVVLDLSVAWAENLLNGALGMGQVRRLGDSRLKELVVDTAAPTPQLGGSARVGERTLWLALDGLSPSAMLDATERMASDCRRCVLLVGPGPIDRLERVLAAVADSHLLHPELRSLVLVAPNALGAGVSVRAAGARVGEAMQAQELSASGWPQVWPLMCAWASSTTEKEADPGHAAATLEPKPAGAAPLPAAPPPKRPPFMVRGFDIHSSEKAMAAATSVPGAVRVVVLDANSGMVIARAEGPLGLGVNRTEQEEEKTSAQIARHAATVRAMLQEAERLGSGFEPHMRAMTRTELHLVRVFRRHANNGLGVMALLVLERNEALMNAGQLALEEVELRIAPRKS